MVVELHQEVIQFCQILNYSDTVLSDSELLSGGSRTSLGGDTVLSDSKLLRGGEYLASFFLKSSQIFCPGGNFLHIFFVTCLNRLFILMKWLGLLKGLQQKTFH